jgi:hypothetical protein
VRYAVYTPQDSAITDLGGGGPPRPDVITPDVAAQMARCGVDLLGLDQLRPDDSRLDALVWSWAQDEPRPGAGDCAAQVGDAARPDGRWFARPCAERRRVACRRGDAWVVPHKATTASGSRILCLHRRAVRGVPRTGYEAQRLRLAMDAAGASEVWLAYRRKGGAGRWSVLEQRISR